MTALVAPAWQGIRADLSTPVADASVAVYSDGEARAFGVSKLNDNSCIFLEGNGFVKGSLVKDVVNARAGVDYDNHNGSNARIAVSFNGTCEAGVSFPVSKETSIVLGAMSMSTRPDNVTIGVNVTPCSHFKVSLSNTFKFSEAGHRKSFSLFAEPSKGTRYAVLAAMGDRDPAEVMVGLSYENLTDSRFEGFKARSFLDVMTMGSRHELCLPFKRSYLSLGLSLGGDWKSPRPGLSLRLHINS